MLRPSATPGRGGDRAVSRTVRLDIEEDDGSGERRLSDLESQAVNFDASRVEENDEDGVAQHVSQLSSSFVSPPSLLKTISVGNRPLVVLIALIIAWIVVFWSSLAILSSTMGQVDPRVTPFVQAKYEPAHRLPHHNITSTFCQFFDSEEPNARCAVHCEGADCFTVVYDTLERPFGRDEITLVTHGPIDRLNGFCKTMHLWRGPKVLVLFASDYAYYATQGVRNTLDTLTNLLSENDWKNVLIVLYEHPFCPRHNVLNSFLFSRDGVQRQFVRYPFGLLENLAWDLAETEFVFPLSVDMLPSKGLYDTAVAAVPSMREMGPKAIFGVPAMAPAFCTSLSKKKVSPLPSQVSKIVAKAPKREINGELLKGWPSDPPFDGPPQYWDDFASEMPAFADGYVFPLVKDDLAREFRLGRVVAYLCRPARLSRHRRLEGEDRTCSSNPFGREGRTATECKYHLNTRYDLWGAATATTSPFYDPSLPTPRLRMNDVEDNGHWNFAPWFIARKSGEWRRVPEQLTGMMIENYAVPTTCRRMNGFKVFVLHGEAFILHYPFASSRLHPFRGIEPEPVAVSEKRASQVSANMLRYCGTD